MSKTLQFKISLMGSQPPIWRKFQVTDDFRFDRFHQVIQIIMGWQNAHLHEFRFQNQSTPRQIGMLLNDDFDLPEIEDETILYLKDVSLNQGDSFLYHYDFGDSWEHVLHLEKISDVTLTHPICIDGARACPPEDCGGIWGYTDLLEVLKNPSDPEYDSWVEWLPQNFDPTFFSLKQTNKELNKFGTWHRKHPRVRSTPWHQI